MNETPLLVGKAYYICDESANGFVGIGILKDINPPNYPTGLFGFTLLDDPDGIDYGVFSRECVGEIAQRQDSLSEQLRDLHRYAVQLGMYDAADWLKANTGDEARSKKTMSKNNTENAAQRSDSDVASGDMVRRFWLFDFRERKVHHASWFYGLGCGTALGAGGMEWLGVTPWFSLYILAWMLLAKWCHSKCGLSPNTKFEQ